MEFCVTEEELETALAAVKTAKANGFVSTLAVLRVYTGGEAVDDFLARYNSVILKAHPTDPKLNWGRDHYPEWHQYVDGKVVNVDRPSKGGDKPLTRQPL